MSSDAVLVKSALLALEDGTCFEGKSVGAKGSVIGEIVFNTSMTGYQEIITDPSYSQQIVTFTYPSSFNVYVNHIKCNKYSYIQNLYSKNYNNFNNKNFWDETLKILNIKYNAQGIQNIPSSHLRYTLQSFSGFSINSLVVHTFTPL